MSIVVHELLHTHPHPKCPTHSPTDSQESPGDVHNDARSCALGHLLPCQVHVAGCHRWGEEAPQTPSLSPFPHFPPSLGLSQSQLMLRSLGLTPPALSSGRYYVSRQETSVAIEALRGHLVRPLQAVHYLCRLKPEGKDYGPRVCRDRESMGSPGPSFWYLSSM